MSFALFGEPAKDDQDAASLRSDHAKPDCPTEVELIFAIGSRRYLVRRRPEQTRPALRGDGEAREQHCAWLFDVTGMRLENISAQNPGQIIAEKKPTEVREALRSILGYGADQFRQIILLPQGRFETFLTAKTAERTKILRELFDVSLYRQLTQKLKDDARAAEEKIRADRRACASRLEQEGFDTREVLEQGVEEAKAERKATSDAAKAAEDAALRADKQLAAAKEIERAFMEHEGAVDALALLGVKSEQIERDKDCCKGAVLARGLSDVDRSTQFARNNAEVAKKALSAAQNVLTKARAAAEAAIQALIKEEGKQKETAALRERLSDLKRHRMTLESASQQELDEKKAAGAARVASEALDAVQILRADIARLHADQLVALKAAEETARRHTNLSASLQEVQLQLDAARRYQLASRAVNAARNDLDNARGNYRKRLEGLRSAEQAYEHAEAALAGAQAIHLAEKLQSDEPCPVCGSRDHPAMAKGDAKSAGLDSAFREARAMLEGARRSEGEGGKTLAAAQATLTERQATLAALTKPDQPVPVLEGTESAMKDDLRALGPRSDLPALRQRIEALQGQLENAEKKLEVARAHRDDTNTKAILAKQVLQSVLGSVPKELRERSALEAAIQAIEQDIAERDAAFVQAAKAERATSGNLIRAIKDEENAASNHARALQAVEATDRELMQRLCEQDLTPEQYQGHKANIDRIETLQAAIETFSQEFAAATDRVGRASKVIEKKERPDISALIRTCEEATEARQDEITKAAEAKARAVHLEDLSKSIAATLAEIEMAESEYQPLGAIAAALNGSNDAKTELETFAIAAMFDHVLAAANIRLQPMTSGRYTLEREQDNAKGSGRRGLGIVVHDTHTGRSRHTTTLSGGETFMAALALALGLSDVVQSLVGGIRLDTIFIDEGFGSLDTETLDQALQTLQDVVGESRAVGIISHVELVQQAIPNGFQIRKTLTGSHIVAQERCS
jgi:exonuclease SbcC